MLLKCVCVCVCGVCAYNTAKTTCPTDPGIHNGVLLGHTDAIWGLSVHPKSGLLLSCAADGSCRLWNHTITSPQLKLIEAESGLVHSAALYCIYSSVCVGGCVFGGVFLCLCICVGKLVYMCVCTS